MSRKRCKYKGIAKSLIITLLIIAAGFMVNLGGRLLEGSAYPRAYTEAVEQYAEEYGLTPSLVFAVMKTESGMRADAVSSVGAIGLMQIMPSTAKQLAERLGEEAPSEEKLFEPEINIRYGCEMLSWMLKEFGSLDTALAAYNAGWGNVKKWLADKNYSTDGVTLHTVPFKETENFISRVNRTEEKYKELYYNGGK